MIRSSIHRFATLTGNPGGTPMLQGRFGQVALCPNTETANYQQKRSDSDRFELTN
ncbi:MAG: hypothetical protein ACRD43_12295 [Pyrinomonadaceae bacterium]